MEELLDVTGSQLWPCSTGNSIGDADCRPAYVEKLVQWLEVNDASLDDEGAKRSFWRAFRSLGDWYADLPPY